MDAIQAIIDSLEEAWSFVQEWFDVTLGNEANFLNLVASLLDDL